VVQLRALRRAGREQRRRSVVGEELEGVVMIVRLQELSQDQEVLNHKFDISFGLSVEYKMKKQQQTKNLPCGVKLNLGISSAANDHTVRKLILFSLSLM
jgi:hypothetical protein